MKVGVVGPSVSVGAVLSEAAEADLPFECVPLVYSHYSESIELVADARTYIDAFLFTGATPYRYALQHLQSEEPWEFLPRNVQSFLCALLKAVFQRGQVIHSVSVDSHGEEAIRAAYAEIGLTRKDIAVFAHTFQVSTPGYLAELIEFHRDNVQSGRAKHCITGVQAVHEELRAAGVPVSKAFSTSEVILQQLQKLYIQLTADTGRENRVAVISLQVVFSKERSLYGKSDMRLFLCKTKAMGEVLSFAERIEAAVEGHDNESCRIYATEAIVEHETKGFSELSLLEDLHKIDGVTLVAAGIGIGKEHGDAKYHADLGRDRALKANRSGFFIVRDDHAIIGPIIASRQDRQTVLVDKELNRVSQKTGIGMDRLQQLERAVRVQGLDAVTPGELAALCGTTLSNMNRLLAKLEKNGYVRVIGKQPSLPLGRPKRLIRLLL